MAGLLIAKPVCPITRGYPVQPGSRFLARQGLLLHAKAVGFHQLVQQRQRRWAGQQHLLGVGSLGPTSCRQIEHSGSTATPSQAGSSSAGRAWPGRRNSRSPHPAGHGAPAPPTVPRCGSVAAPAARRPCRAAGCCAAHRCRSAAGPPSAGARSRPAAGDLRRSCGHSGRALSPAPSPAGTPAASTADRGSLCSGAAPGRHLPFTAIQPARADRGCAGLPMGMEARRCRPSP